VLVGEPFPVQQGGGRKTVAAATDAIRERLAALVATLDTEIASSSASFMARTTT
jgi:hypothetical protein